MTITVQMLIEGDEQEAPGQTEIAVPDIRVGESTNLITQQTLAVASSKPGRNTDSSLIQASRLHQYRRIVGSGKITKE